MEKKTEIIQEYIDVESNPLIVDGLKKHITILIGAEPLPADGNLGEFEDMRTCLTKFENTSEK